MVHNPALTTQLSKSYHILMVEHTVIIGHANMLEIAIKSQMEKTQLKNYKLISSMYVLLCFRITFSKQFKIQAGLFIIPVIQGYSDIIDNFLICINRDL